MLINPQKSEFASKWMQFSVPRLKVLRIQRIRRSLMQKPFTVVLSVTVVPSDEDFLRFALTLSRWEASIFPSGVFLSDSDEKTDGKSANEVSLPRVTSETSIVLVLNGASSNHRAIIFFDFFYWILVKQIKGLILSAISRVDSGTHWLFVEFRF